MMVFGKCVVTVAIRLSSVYYLGGVIKAVRSRAIRIDMDVHERALVLRCLLILRKTFRLLFGIFLRLLA